jgi:hypothetical protein
VTYWDRDAAPAASVRTASMTAPDSPTCAGMPLHRNGEPCAGAAFELQSAARESGTVVIDNWEAEVSGGTSLVVVRGGMADDYHSALTGGLAYAQKALDIMSLRGGNNLLIKGFEDDHVTWWREPAGLVIRIMTLGGIHLGAALLKGRQAAWGMVLSA